MSPRILWNTNDIYKIRRQLSNNSQISIVLVFQVKRSSWYYSDWISYFACNVEHQWHQVF